MNKVSVFCIGIFTFLLLAFGSRYVLKTPPIVSQKQVAAVSSSQTQSQANLVTAADSGFSPDTITIKAGDTVTFKNESSRPVWPASDPHPVHTAYPQGGGCIASAFDACRGLNQGEEWSFQFNVKGTWKFHDHLNPRDHGTVVVE